MSSDVDSITVSPTEGAEIELSGIVLASIQMDLTIEEGFVEGLLFGKHKNQTISVPSDFESNKQVAKSSIRIWSYVITGNSGYSFYNLKGQMDENRLGELEKKFNKSIVGWFTTRPYGSPMQPSLREFRVQEQLSRFVAKVTGNDTAPLVFALFRSCVESGSTPMHHFKYKFFHSVCPQVTSASSVIKPTLIKIITSEIKSKEEYESYTSTSMLSSCPELYDRIGRHLTPTIEIRSSTENVVDSLLKDMSLMCGENIDENDERDIFRLLEGIKKFNSRA
eukprot:g15881.t1